MSTVEFDTDRELFQAEFDRTHDSVSLAVVALVATVRDKEPDLLAPLYSSIDVDALEELFADSTITQQGGGRISFTYEGLEVTVCGDGKIEAVPLETTSEGDFETALQEQKQRVLAELDEEKTLDATPIIRHDESLSSEEYLTLVYELHHVHLPELQANELVEFDRQADEVRRGPQFAKKCPSPKSGDKR
ncbi:HalOD1 output domain-containing protein [Halorussus aquaticus]|uniref:HalOD1 output domain-containing protein n=1 Tax=Halorussus aquaticus TaxID=2953748 RepID=A0ABD5Q7D6_9EURY|nr:HalOD1 output domain-containing protein [Halorussus aquaticus]